VVSGPGGLLVAFAKSSAHTHIYTVGTASQPGRPEHITGQANTLNPHGGGIIEEESWRRNHGGGIIEEGSGMRSHGGGIIARRHPGGTRRHPSRLSTIASACAK